ncbi:MAG: magnesium transporter, partial [Chloroflexi bacterium]
MPLSLTEEQTRGLNLEYVSSSRLTWVYIERPTQAEVDFLARHFPQFHSLNLDDVLSRVQRPKIDEYEDHLFLVLHFPVFHKEARITAPSEVDIFVGEDYMVTIHCNGDLKPLSSFFKACQASEEMRRNYLEHSSGYLLYQVLDRLVNYCFPILGK